MRQRRSAAPPCTGGRASGANGTALACPAASAAHATATTGHIPNAQPTGWPALAHHAHFMPPTHLCRLRRAHLLVLRRSPPSPTFLAVTKEMHEGGDAQLPPEAQWCHKQQRTAPHRCAWGAQRGRGCRSTCTAHRRPRLNAPSARAARRTRRAQGNLCAGRVKWGAQVSRCTTIQNNDHTQRLLTSGLLAYDMSGDTLRALASAVEAREGALGAQRG